MLFSLARRPLLDDEPADDGLSLVTLSVDLVRKWRPSVPSAFFLVGEHGDLVPPLDKVKLLTRECFVLGFSWPRSCSAVSRHVAVVAGRAAQSLSLGLCPVLADKLHLDRVVQVAHLVPLVLGDVPSVQHGFQVSVDVLFLHDRPRRIRGRRLRLLARAREHRQDPGRVAFSFLPHVDGFWLVSLGFFVSRGGVGCRVSWLERRRVLGVEGPGSWFENRRLRRVSVRRRPSDAPGECCKRVVEPVVQRSRGAMLLRSGRDIAAELRIDGRGPPPLPRRLPQS